MPWWGLVGIGFLAAVAIFSFIVLILDYAAKKNVVLAIDMLESERERMENDLQAERVAKKAIEKEFIRLNEKYRQINVWYTKRKEDMKVSIRDEYETMVDDPQFLDDKLNCLLGLSNTFDSSGDTERSDEGSETRNSKERR